MYPHSNIEIDLGCNTPLSMFKSLYRRRLDLWKKTPAAMHRDI